MLRLLKYTSLLCLLWLLTFAQAHANPQPFQATLTFHKSGLTIGDTQISLSFTDNTYTYQKSMRTTGLAAAISGDTLTERSIGTRRGAHLAPQSYFRHHQSRRRDRREDFTFIQPNQVRGTYEGEAYSLQVPGTTVDPSLLELRLMADVAANRPLQYHVTERGRLRQYTFQRLGREQVTVPAGQFMAEKIHREDGDRSTTLWLAPELNYMIVLIRHNEKGDIVESRLASFTPR